MRSQCSNTTSYVVEHNAIHDFKLANRVKRNVTVFAIVVEIKDGCWNRAQLGKDT